MEEAAAGSLCCHHRDEWRLPLAQMLPGGAPERIVAIDRRNTRRESSQGEPPRPFLAFSWRYAVLTG